MIEKDYTIDEQYKDLLQTILSYGKEKKDRTGTGTKSIFGYTLRHDMTQGFPLLTTKKVAYKSMITELRWMLKGDTNIKWLLENDCHIWTGDAYNVYERTHQWDLDNDYLNVKDFEKKILEDNEFARLWGNLGFIYGKQWRDFGGDKRMGEGKLGVDQISDLIDEIRRNPDSRRLMVNAWNASDLIYMKLPPCHYGFQIYTTELTLEERQQEFCDRLGKSIHFAKNLDHDFLDKDDVPKRKISLMWNQRSVDVFLGLPFNIASYALLLKLIADEVNMVPDQLVGNLGDTHLYLNHLDQAKKQLKREPYCLPELEVSKVDILNGDFNYELHSYESHPSIKAPLSN
jgi:thymidylate synthase